MIRQTLLALAAAIAVMVPWSAAQAASVSLPNIDAAVTGAAPANIIEVHGRHRACRWGPKRGWYHRHRGYGRPRACKTGPFGINKVCGYRYLCY